LHLAAYILKIFVNKSVGAKILILWQKTPLFGHCATSLKVIHNVKNNCLTSMQGGCTIKLQRGSAKLPKNSPEVIADG
jgi:hypothetical protein